MFNLLTLILLILVTFTFIVYISPDALSFLSGKLNMSDDQLSNFLAAMDVALSSCIAVYTIMDQKRVEKRCQYDFTIETDSLSFNHYKRYPTEIKNAYRYEYCRKKEDGIEEPFYLADIPLQEEAVASIDIPFTIQVLTGLFGNSIEFSRLNIYACKNGRSIGVNYKKTYKFLRIVEPIRDGKKFLVRLKLLCDYELQQALQDSRIYVNFKTTLQDDRGRKYKKYTFIMLQRINGETRILEVDSSHSWILHIRKLAGIMYSPAAPPWVSRKLAS